MDLNDDEIFLKKYQEEENLKKKQWNGEKTTVRGWGETPNGYIKNL